jgi:hypothetical protein
MMTRIRFCWRRKGCDRRFRGSAWSLCVILVVMTATEIFPSVAAAAPAPGTQGENGDSGVKSSYVHTVLGRDIPGRPLAVRRAQSIRFQSHAAPEHGLRSETSGESLEVRQLIVKTTETGRDNVREELEQVVGRRGMRYLPQDFFVVSMTEVQTKSIVTLPDCIGVYDLPWELKVDPSLLEESDNKATGEQARTRTVTSKRILVSLGHGASLHDDVLAHWSTVLLNSTEYPKGVHLKRVSTRNVMIELKSDDQYRLNTLSRLAVTWLAQQNQVLWIEEDVEIAELHTEVDQMNRLRPADGKKNTVQEHTTVQTRSISNEIHTKDDTDLRNQNAVATAQGGTDPRARLHQAGFFGHNQIVGMADTGLDYDGCYFHDTSEDAYMQRCNWGIESLCSPASGKTQHRKVT